MKNYKIGYFREEEMLIIFIDINNNYKMEIK
jgi:hypothetical protein